MAKPDAEKSYIGVAIGSELVTRKYGDVFHLNLRGSSAATASNYTAEWYAHRALEIIEVVVSFTVASTSGTLQLERLTSGQAPGAGTTILNSTISLAGTANTPVVRIQSQMTSGRVLQQGDRIGLIDGGTLTNLTDLIVQIYYKPSARGDYR